MSNEDEVVQNEQEVKEEIQTVTLPTNIDLNELVNIANSVIEAANSAPTLKEKLKSRKFWIAVAGVVVGILALFGTGCSNTGLLTFAIVEVGSIFGFCFAEGKVDAERTAKLLEAAAIIAGAAANPGGSFPDITEDSNIPNSDENINTDSNGSETSYSIDTNMIDDGK